MKEESVKPVSKPYRITIENTSDKEQRAVLFGYNMNFLSKNFGSDNGIVISCGKGFPYSQMLAQSAMQPFDIGQFLIQLVKSAERIALEQRMEQLLLSGSLKESTVAEVLNALSVNVSEYIPRDEMMIEYVDANRRSCTDPVDLVRDIYQTSLWEFLLTYPVKVDGNTSICIDIAPKKKIMISMYPRAILVPSSSLIDADPLKKFGEEKRA